MKKFGEWFKGLTDTKQALLILTIIIGLFAVGGAISPNTTKTANKEPTTPTSPQPKITIKTITETQDIPFGSKTVESSSLPKGQSKVTTSGVNGTRQLTYKITYTDDQQSDKELVKNEVILQPVTQITTVGTYVAPAPAPAPQHHTASNCDPNYSGACVPNVYPADVDCAGGSGNGPYYVQGPVYVTGVDRYGLDGNGDGVGCQN